MQAYREYEWELLKFLGRRLGSTATASDIAQDLYIKLLRVDEHPPIKDLRAYLFRMAANLATDHLRVEKRRTEILVESEGVLSPPNNALTPERYAMAREELDFMEAEIAKFPLRCREVFYLARYKGMTQPEIAEELGVGLTTVYKDLKKALNLLVQARRRFLDFSS